MNKQNKIENTKTVFFIGIAGVGLSAVAGIAIEKGMKVLGSDLSENQSIKKLKSLGAHIYIGHNTKNITKDIDLVVTSSAISNQNPEIKEAKRKKIKIIHRSEMLNLLLNDKKIIAVAGSHGKTTTTSLVSAVLLDSNTQPTISIGAIWDKIESTYKFGKGDFAVIEADESDGTFLNYDNHIAIITNIDYEHVDFYQNLDQMILFFKDFANKVPKDGYIIMCENDKNCQIIKKNLNKNFFTYGINTHADVVATDITWHNNETHFSIKVKKENKYKFFGKFILNKLGIHNVQNSLAAVCVGLILNIQKKYIYKALKNSGNVDRRMQLLFYGDINIKEKQIKNLTILQDYAHHPTEISATISALKNKYKKNIITVFQPHRYSRTQMFKEDFAKSLMLSDFVFITDIYGAFEKNNSNINSKNIVDLIKKENFKKCEFFSDYNELLTKLKKIISNDDLILVLGAGSIEMTAKKLAIQFKEKSI